MRQIGQAISMYANDHNGQFPDDLQTVLENEDVTSAVFVCPESNDQPAIGPTTQATAAALLQPGHLSYIYLGKGLTTQTVTDDTVILYEPLANHGSKGMNVMFGDFHVEWLPAADAATILKQQAAGTRPIKYAAKP
jgi:prepilin-type processing-associated H-X9-DG protein